MGLDSCPRDHRASKGSLCQQRTSAASEMGPPSEGDVRGNGATEMTATSLRRPKSSTMSSAMPAVSGTKRVPLRTIGDELQCPDVAWPTLALFLVAISGYLLPGVLTFRNPGWGTVPISAVFNYLLFTPAHDAVHRAVSAKYRWLNELVGWVSAVAFQSPFSAFRYVHLQHHKFTNDPRHDPDTWSSGTGNPWTALFYWATQSVYYYVYYYKRLNQRPVSEALQIIAVKSLFILVIVMALWNGYHRQVFYFMYAPKFLAESFLSYSFDYAPHRPHVITRAEDIYKCTNMMSGLMSPDDGIDLSIPLLYQNLHNVHHLYPSIPFYRYCVVWSRHKKTLLELGTPLTSWWTWTLSHSKHAEEEAKAQKRQ